MKSDSREVVEQGFEQDRQDYWTIREELLAKYPGKWVSVHKGRVVAVGDDPLSIMEQALAEDGYAYTNKVGEEDKIVIRQRRVSFPYDDTYSPTPIPRITAVLHNCRRAGAKQWPMPSPTRAQISPAYRKAIARISIYSFFPTTRGFPILLAAPDAK